jgi:anti-sigma regulatory factor (Ser/Thr protein kinase)
MKESIRDFLLNAVKEHPRDLVSVAMRKFHVTRPAVHKHLNALIQENLIQASGRTRNKIYTLKPVDLIHQIIPLPSEKSEDEIWKDFFEEKARQLPIPVYKICYYGVTEMINNVLDHSAAKRMELTADFQKGQVTFTIADNGIGIFEKIKSAFHLSSYRESILELSKGKVTTDSTHHSGEGIFFTSRVFDSFTLFANNLCFIRYNEVDWLIEEAPRNKGTTVILKIQKNSTRNLENVFRDYTDLEDASFSKTKIIVALAKMPDEDFMSRSQAKRILHGLEKFKHIILDFDKVRSVGQGFVDEVFRVFQNQYPQIKIDHYRANENVEFMIKRSLKPI